MEPSGFRSGLDIEQSLALVLDHLADAPQRPALSRTDEPRRRHLRLAERSALAPSRQLLSSTSSAVGEAWSTHFSR
jgi:hypothetical protein